MPKKGQRSVTLNKKVYDKAKELADKEGKSIAGLVTELILENIQLEVPA